MKAQGEHEGGEKKATREECVGGEEEETSSMYDANNVPKRHMTWWRNASDHTCGRREAVGERDVQPPEQPSRLAAQNGPRRSTHQSAAEQWCSRGSRSSSSRSHVASKCLKARNNNNSNCNCCAISSGTSRPCTTFAAVTWASSTTLTTSLRFGRRWGTDIHQLKTKLMLYLRIHSAPCRYVSKNSAEDIRRELLSVAEVAMSVFELASVMLYRRMSTPWW